MSSGWRPIVVTSRESKIGYSELSDALTISTGAPALRLIASTGAGRAGAVRQQSNAAPMRLSDGRLRSVCDLRDRPGKDPEGQPRGGGSRVHERVGGALRGMDDLLNLEQPGTYML